MISNIVDNIYIGNWQDARDNTNSFIIFTVASDSPFIGNFYYKIEDSRNADYNELLSAITSLYRIRITDRTSNILVHCVSGFSRSTTVVAGYLMLRYKMSFHEAISFIKVIRPYANPNPGLVEIMINSKELNYGRG